MTNKLLSTELCQLRITCDDAYKIAHVYKDYPLNKLSNFIFKAFKFKDKKTTQFMIATSKRACSSELEPIDQNVSLESLYPLPKGHFLFLTVGYYKEHIFKIFKMAKQVYRLPKTRYPHIIEEHGENPMQCGEVWGESYFS